MRSRTNRVSGWLLAFGLWAGSVAVDPLHLYSVWSDVPPDERWYVQLPRYAVFMVMAVGAFAVLARPRLELSADSLTIRNPLRDVFVPLANITKAETDGKYPVIHTDGGRHTAWGAESLNVQTGSGISAAVAARVSEETLARPEVQDVAWKAPGHRRDLCAHRFVARLPPDIGRRGCPLGLQPG